MSRSNRARPYFSDYSAHCLRHFLARELDPDPTPFNDLSECSRHDLTAAGKAISEMTSRQRLIINECYSPVTSIQMFNIQFDGACEQLGISRNDGFAELHEALYRVAWHRGLINKPFKRYKYLYESEK